MKNAGAGETCRLFCLESGWCGQAGAHGRKGRWKALAALPEWLAARRAETVAQPLHDRGVHLRDSGLDDAEQSANLFHGELFKVVKHQYLPFSSGEFEQSI